MRVTIKDIAQATGYSTATVSLYLITSRFGFPNKRDAKFLLPLND